MSTTTTARRRRKSLLAGIRRVINGCSPDLRALLTYWGIGWRKYADKLAATKCSDDEVAYLAWLSMQEFNKFRAFHVRLNDPKRFLIPVFPNEKSSPLQMYLFVWAAFLRFSV